MGATEYIEFIIFGFLAIQAVNFFTDINLTPLGLDSELNLLIIGIVVFGFIWGFAKVVTQ